MDYDTLSMEEKKFVETYGLQLKTLQKQAGEFEVIYTKIQLNYVFKHNLLFINLLFHPLNVSKKRIGDYVPITQEGYKELFKNIIEFECSKSLKETCLTESELDAIIKHYNSI